MSQSQESEAETLAHAVVDIDEVCKVVTNQLVPRLFDSAATDEQIQEALADLGEQFRHFLYHVRDPQYFRFLPGCERGNEEDLTDG